MGFMVFSFMASVVYIINDLRDIEADKKHPRKQKRPLAAGKITPVQAILTACLLFIAAMALSAQMLSIRFVTVVLLYFFLNLFYTYYGKQISILDVVIISIGFVLRIKAGGIVGEIPLSQWIIVMVFLLALFLAIAKRRDDLVIKEKMGIDLRVVSKQYTIDFLNIALSLITGVIIVAYLMYCLSPAVMDRMGTHRIFYTVLFVICGVLRYLQITIVDKESGSPSAVLLKDRFIQVVLAGWIVSFYFLVYYDTVISFIKSLGINL